MPRPKGTTQYPPEMIYRAADLFLNGDDPSVNEIAVTLEREFDWPRLHRQEIYRLVRYAVDAKYVRLVPPLEPTLADQIAERFKFDKDQKVVVVRTPRPKDNHLVAEAAADVALGRARELFDRGHRRVGLGLTTGRASADFARRLAELMQANRAFKFSLHALAGGGPTDTEYSPISFFTYFRRGPEPTDPDGPPHSVGLFTPTVCRSAEELARIQSRADFQKALRHREHINLICASIGVQCEHDLHRLAIEDEKRSSGQKSFDYFEWAQSRKIVGNINYRPFTSLGNPYVEKKNEYRAITLFEIADYLEFRRRGGYLILIGRRCGTCNNLEAVQRRARGLLPLLTSPRLRVFSDLVIDEVLADLVLKLSQRPEAE